MQRQRYTLTQVPHHERAVDILKEAGLQAASLRETQVFDLNPAETETLRWFLSAVKGARSVRHTYTDDRFLYDYDPQNPLLNRLVITWRATGATMGYSPVAMWRLLDALQGKTERLAAADDDDEEEGEGA